MTYLLEIAAHGRELFEHAEPNEKRELIGLLGQNLFLDGNQVQITLYKPFSDIASCLDGSVWLPIPEVLLSKYYGVIKEIAREVELASSYLGTSAEFSGRVKPMLVSLNK